MNRDFVELLECLVAREVRFLVVGGYALAAHGHPRYTKDLDIWVWMDPGNADAVVRALDDFGFGSVGLQPGDFLTPDSIVQLGYPPERVDLITTPDGVTFEECWQRQMSYRVGELVVPFIGLEDLITNKLASGRDQDLVDVRVLQQLKDPTASDSSPTD